MDPSDAVCQLKSCHLLRNCGSKYSVNVSRLHPVFCRLHTHTHTRLTAFFPGLPSWAGTRKVKPIWILLKQETVSGSGSGISWAICKSAPRSRQITTPAPHHSVFTGRMPFLPPNQQRQSTEGQMHWMIIQTIQRIFNFTNILVLYIFSTKFGNFWHNKHILITNCCKVINSRKQSVFWPTLYMTLIKSYL